MREEKGKEINKFSKIISEKLYYLKKWKKFFKSANQYPKFCNQLSPNQTLKRLKYPSTVPFKSKNLLETLNNALPFSADCNWAGSDGLGRVHWCVRVLRLRVGRWWRPIVPTGRDFERVLVEMSRHSPRVCSTWRRRDLKGHQDY